MGGVSVRPVERQVCQTVIEYVPYEEEDGIAPTISAEELEALQGSGFRDYYTGQIMKGLLPHQPGVVSVGGYPKLPPAEVPVPAAGFLFVFAAAAALWALRGKRA